MKKVKIIGIKWDIDNKKDLAHLPKSMILDIPNDIEEDELEDFICDELSNTSGFCHHGWEEHEQIDICSECGKEMTQNDECYCDHESGLALCDACSVQCRGCGNAIASSKVVGNAEYYCNACDAKFHSIPSLSGMSFDQFEKLDGAFTYPYYSGFAEGYCASNGMVHCKVEGAYEWLFANRKDAFERLMKDNREVPYAYLELNNGFSMESLLSCIQTIENTPTKLQQKCFDVNNYTTRQLIEMEFQNVPNSEHKDDLIIGALQLTENGYTVREAVSTSLEITGLPQLSAIEDNFLTFVGAWINGKDCRTGVNRARGTVTYHQDGLYLYEFKTREDAFKYLFEDDRSVPYAFAEYDEKASERNGEETFGEWEFNNGFTDDGLQTLGLNDKKTQLLSLIFDMSVNGVNLIDISKEKNFVDIVDSDDATFQIFTQDGTVTVDWGEGENAIDVYADSSVNEELVKAFRYQMFPLFTMEQVFDYLQSKK